MKFVAFLLVFCFIRHHPVAQEMTYLPANSVPAQTRYIPGVDAQHMQIDRDDGIGNYGDLIYKNREPGDELYIHDILIVKNVQSVDQILRWQVSAFGKIITTVRAFNIGRQRAITENINVNGDRVELSALVKKNTDPRLLVEVYVIDPLNPHPLTNPVFGK